jgi:hypothetical protein
VTRQTQGKGNTLHKMTRQPAPVALAEASGTRLTPVVHGTAAGSPRHLLADLHRHVSLSFTWGVPTTVDAGTRYLKITVYHTRNSSPCHEGCAAHGSNDHQAVAAALDRLNQFRRAIDDSFCCGASTDILLPCHLPVRDTPAGSPVEVVEDVA